MTASRHTMRARGRQTPAATLLAVFALLLQSLLPAAALAAQSAKGRGETIVICTQMGVQTLRTGETKTPAKGFAGLPCQDCLGAATAATPAAAGPSLEPVVYVDVRAERVVDPAVLPMGARAPPRPPGQGPPTL